MAAVMPLFDQGCPKSSSSLYRHHFDKTRDQYDGAVKCKRSTICPECGAKEFEFTLRGRSLNPPVKVTIRPVHVQLSTFNLHIIGANILPYSATFFRRRCFATN